MAKSRKKSGSDENSRTPLVVIGGLAAAAVVYVFIQQGAQNPQPQAPPIPPPVVVAPDPAAPVAAPDAVATPDAAGNPMPAGNPAAPGSPPAVASLTPKAPSTGTPGVGQLLPKTAPSAAEAAQATSGRVRPKRRPAGQIEVAAKDEEDLDAEPRPAGLSGYADSLKLTGVGYNAELVGDWNAKPDPLEGGLPPNKQADKLKAKINAPGAAWDDTAVLFPVVPSPFVVVGSNVGRGNFREVFSLETGKTASQIKGIEFAPTLQALSPDGKFYAAIVRQSPQWIEVWDVQKKASLEHVAAVPAESIEQPAAPAPAPMNDAIKIGKSRPMPMPVAQPMVKVPDELMPRVLAFPRPDRLLVGSDSRVQIWSIPERERVVDFEIENAFAAEGGPVRTGMRTWNREADPIANLAISPGGRYGAVVQAADGMQYVLNLFDLETGKSVGQFEIQRRKSSFFARSQFHAAAFSPDGKELAALFETEKGCRILIWDLATGKIADWVPFGLDQKPRWGKSYAPLAWFPAGNRFLVDGVHIIDRVADAWLFSLPDSRHCSSGSRHVVNDETVTVVDDDDFRITGLVGYQLDTDALDRAREIIADGGSAIDSVLPPLTKVEESPIEDRTEQDAVPWSVQADPGPALPETLSDASVKVPEVNPLTQVLNSRSDGSRAFFGFANPFNFDLKKNPRRIEIVDLVKRKPLKPLPIEFPFKLFATSPQGKRLALRAEAKKPTGRIEIYDVEAGQPLCSWRPYDADVPEEKRKDVVSALFIDEDHVATLSATGQFVMWEIPTCKPLYSRDLPFLMLPTVSPGGKYLAFVYDDAIELCDAQTGLLKGEFVTGNPSVGIAFHPEGKRMAVLLEAAGNRFLTDVNLTSGQMSPTYVVPGVVSESATPRDRMEGEERPQRRETRPKTVSSTTPARVEMQWCEGDRVLIDHSQLFDFEHRRIVWTYTTRQPLVWLNVGDGRLWYATPSRVVWGTKGRTTVPSKLLALAIPQPEAEEAIADGANNSVRYALRPGGTISLDLQLIAPPDDPQFEAKVRAHLVQEFAKAQIKVGNFAPASLTLKMTEGTGESRTYRRIGEGTEETLNVKSVTMQATIIAEGVPHWECNYTVSNSAGFIVYSDPKLGLQGTQDRNLQRSSAALPYRFRAPAYVIHRDDQNGFGATELSDQGYVKKGADSSVTTAPER